MLKLIIVFISGRVCGSTLSAIIMAAVQINNPDPPPWER
jgi:hypothetical protein